MAVPVLFWSGASLLDLDFRTGVNLIACLYQQHRLYQQNKWIVEWNFVFYIENLDEPKQSSWEFTY